MKKILILFALVSVMVSGQEQESLTEKVPFVNRLKADFTINGILPVESGTVDFIKGDLKSQNSFAPTVNVIYELKPHWGLEFSLGITRLTLSTYDSYFGMVVENGIVLPSHVNLPIGKVWAMPVSVNVHYYYTASPIVPYVGGGINYTPFFGSSGGEDVKDFSVNGSLGLNALAGLNYQLDKDYYINANVRFTFMRSKSNLDLSEIDADDPQVAAKLKSLDGQFNFHPFFVGFGIGKYF